MVNDRQRLSTVDENLQVLGRLGGGGGESLRAPLGPDLI